MGDWPRGANYQKGGKKASNGKGCAHEVKAENMESRGREEREIDCRRKGLSIFWVWGWGGV